ncbi:hypothetical protein [Methylocapsa aurea]|uniref:hypothetical protein n=1 Tax=Methylocapsa aurea TaxID=663610 RepID=UPI003D18BA59
MAAAFDWRAGVYHGIEIAERHKSQSTEQQLEDRFMTRIEFDNETMAVEIDPSAFDPTLTAKPSEDRLGQRSIHAQRRRIEPRPAPHEVTDSDLHFVNLPNASSGPIRPA